MTGSAVSCRFLAQASLPEKISLALVTRPSLSTAHRSGLPFSRAVAASLACSKVAVAIRLNPLRYPRIGASNATAQEKTVARRGVQPVRSD
jgi:hypothetical protein